MSWQGRPCVGGSEGAGRDVGWENSEGRATGELTWCGWSRIEQVKTKKKNNTSHQQKHSSTCCCWAHSIRLLISPGWIKHPLSYSIKQLFACGAKYTLMCLLTKLPSYPPMSHCQSSLKCSLEIFRYLNLSLWMKNDELLLFFSILVLFLFTNQITFTTIASEPMPILFCW